ncbi:MAG: DUF72 domain-containing protein [Desulfobacterales bacterium]
MTTAPSAVSSPPCRLYVGTSGYSYTEWVAAGFYPPGTSAGRMLALYARHFPITEINATAYQLPRAETLERRLRQVPPTFLFAVRLTRTLTHEIDAQRWPDLARDYRDGLAPLLQSRQLAAVLIQLPPTFDRTAAHRRYLAGLLDALEGLPLAVEFRHRSWANDRVLHELERRRVALVAVDGPSPAAAFPVWEAVTSPDLFCIRFPGRNDSGRRAGKAARQFDYGYSDEELGEWAGDRIERLSRRARRGILLFGNHVQAQAPQNARRMMGLLRRAGWPVGTVEPVWPVKPV